MKTSLPTLRRFCFVLCFLAFGSAKAQYVTIPDSNFVNFLKKTYPGCMNGNQMDTTCSGIVNETFVYCTGLSIADLTGVEYFDKVTTLQCQANKLTSLPPLPKSITTLNCASNKLTSLQNLPPSLTFLGCTNNKLTTLPTLPNSLKDIYCDSNPLTSLPALPTSLRFFSCRSSQLTSLPALPAHLLSLDCTFSPLTSLPALPDSLGTLNCTGNMLDSLPALPNTLKSLWCDGNGLYTLPTLSNTSLDELMCFDNRLVTLPALPKSLVKLYCYNNQLTNLPALPDTLNELNCSSNQLTSLPALPATLYMLLVRSNRNLSCIPPFKKFTGNSYTFSIQFTKIKCLPNVIQHAGSFPPIDTLPVCDLFNNPNGCELGWNIQGTVFNDSSSDCLFQNNEVKIPLVKMNLYEGSTLVESAYFNGNYSFKPGLGTYTVGPDTTGLPFNFCKTDTTLAITLQDSLKYNIDFALECKPGFDVGVKSIINGRLRPGTTSQLNINAGDLSNFYGAECAAGNSGTVTAFITGPVKYISPSVGSLTPDNVIGDTTITWNVSDWGTIDLQSSFHIIIQVDTTATLDSEICATIVVTSSEDDYDTSNDTLTNCFPVRGSYDPNDKQAYPAGKTDISTNWITYTVRFQNTGTDTAIHIYIMDTLDTNLRPSTFQLLGYSTLPVVQIFEPGIIKFNFPNIMLPDSNVNEPASHGYVQYRVMLKDALPVSTEIKNTGYIYFDFNAPVVTNTTVNTISIDIPTAVLAQESDIQLQVYPNPANDKLFITTNGFAPGQISIYDLSGQKVISQQFTSQLNISQLPAGIYFMEVADKKTTARNRFVKL